MTIEEAIFAYLSVQPSLSEVGDRIYPLGLPQTPTYPAITYRPASTTIPMAHDGPGDFISRRIQFDCYDPDYATVKRVSKALRRAINGFKGTMGEVQVHGVFYITEVEDFGDVAEVERVAVDFKFNYKESD